MISFIVSSYDCPEDLNACLATLVIQEGDNGIIICDNGQGSSALDEGVPALSVRYGAAYEWTAPTCKTCYESANIVATMANGDWLCFPSDDSLYVRDFAKLMLKTAEKHNADLVYCDCLYRQLESVGEWPAYTVLNTQPRMGRIDKTCFILKRELFRGFPPHPRDWRDGALIEQLVRDGVRHAKAPGVLVLHQ